MPYIGKQPTVGNFQVCDAISVVNGQAAYTMQVNSTNVTPETAFHMLVSLNGVLQKPGSSFTISGSTITFASNLATGDVIDFIILLGDVLNIGTPSDDTVTAAKLNDDIISGQTAETSIATDDVVLIHDTSAGALRKMTRANFVSGVGGDNTPSFFAYVSADYSLSDATHTLLAANTELWDTDTAYTNTASNYKFTVPSGEAGKYQFTIGFKATHGAGSIQQAHTELYKNGSEIIRTENGYHASEYSDAHSQSNTFTVDLSESDYVQAYIYVNNAHNSAMTLVGGNSPIISFFSGFKLIT
jgi:hypothetical protein